MVGGPVRIMLHILLKCLNMNCTEQIEMPLFSKHIDLLRFLLFHERSEFFDHVIGADLGDGFLTNTNQESHDPVNKLTTSARQGSIDGMLKMFQEETKPK